MLEKTFHSKPNPQEPISLFPKKSLIIAFYQEIFEFEPKKTFTICTNPSFFDDLKAPNHFQQSYTVFCSSIHFSLSQYETLLLFKIHLKAFLALREKEERNKALLNAKQISKSFLKDIEKRIFESQNELAIEGRKSFSFFDEKKLRLKDLETISSIYFDLLGVAFKKEKDFLDVSLFSDFNLLPLSFFSLFIQKSPKKECGSSLFDHLREKYTAIICIGSLAFLFLTGQHSEIFFDLLKTGLFRKTGLTTSKFFKLSSKFKKSCFLVQRALKSLTKDAAYFSDDLFFLFYMSVFKSYRETRKPMTRLQETLFQACLIQFPHRLVSYFTLEELQANPLGLKCFFCYTKTSHDSLENGLKLLLKRFFSDSYANSKSKEAAVFLDYLIKAIFQQKQKT